MMHLHRQIICILVGAVVLHGTSPVQAQDVPTPSENLQLPPFLFPTQEFTEEGTGMGLGIFEDQYENHIPATGGWWLFETIAPTTSPSIFLPTLRPVARPVRTKSPTRTPTITRTRTRKPSKRPISSKPTAAPFSLRPSHTSTLAPSSSVNDDMFGLIEDMNEDSVPDLMIDPDPSERDNGMAMGLPLLLVIIIAAASFICGMCVVLILKRSKQRRERHDKMMMMMMMHGSEPSLVGSQVFTKGYSGGRSGSRSLHDLMYDGPSSHNDDDDVFHDVVIDDDDKDDRRSLESVELPASSSYAKDRVVEEVDSNYDESITTSYIPPAMHQGSGLFRNHVCYTDSKRFVSANASSLLSTAPSDNDEISIDLSYAPTVMTGWSYPTGVSISAHNPV
jgi:hypothetical protein